MLRSVALACVVLAGCAQRNLETRPLSQRAAAIDGDVARMQLDTTIVFGFATGGTSLEAAREGQLLRRLRAEHLGESGRFIETFYFDSALIYVTNTQCWYDAPLSGRVRKCDSMSFDLTLPNVSATTADSLRAAAADLRSRLRNPR
jgi:hypothetical protein